MKPILFNTEMVRAILAGKKTVTRRVIKPPPKSPVVNHCGTWQETQACVNGLRVFTPPYKPGDILYVRETWSFWPCWDCDIDCNSHQVCYNGEHGCFVYKAQKDKVPYNDKWRPSIHMPKKAARIFLRVTGVRVERLKDITANDAMNEGFSDWNHFALLWDSTIPKHPNKFKRYPYYWKDNPWVWVIEFERRLIDGTQEE